MFKQLTDMPDGVLGFEASGKIEAADYQNVLTAPVEAARQERRRPARVRPRPRLRRLLGRRRLGGHEVRGASPHRLEAPALVSDHEWVNHLAGLFGWMVPGKFKHFPLAEKDKAITWAAADD